MLHYTEMLNVKFLDNCNRLVLLQGISSQESRNKENYLTRSFLTSEGPWYF
jgi:hypothetical protein